MPFPLPSRLALLGSLFLFTLIAPCLCFAADASRIATGKSLLDLDGTRATISEMQRRFDLYTAEYRKRLSQARPKAVTDGDVEEVQRIDRALNGDYISEYSDRVAQDARRFYDEKLSDLARDLLAALSRDIKSQLAAGKTEDAATVKTVVDFLNQHLERMSTQPNGKMQATFTVDASKDWQSTGIVLKNASRVWIEAQGRWAPGGATSRDKVDLADADTYNLQICMGGKESQNFKGGKNWDFVTEVTGEISARMIPLRIAKRSEARGRLTVKVTWKEVEGKSGAAQNSLEKILSELLRSNQTAAATPPMPAIPTAPIPQPATGKNAGGATAQTAPNGPQTSNIILRATDDNLKTGIHVNSGDRIIITAVGEWTPNKEKNPPANADARNYVVTIGKSLLGRLGKKADMLANDSGEISLRPDFVGWAKAREFTPDGSLKITITVIPAVAPTK